MCKKEFSVYFILTLSLSFVPFLSYDALRICFLTHLVQYGIEERKRKDGAKTARSVPYFRLKIVVNKKATEIRSFPERIGGSNTRREREQKEQNKKSQSLPSQEKSN
jgi:hypothetical protein